MIRHRFFRGFSLLEMALVMATIGFLMIMVISLKGTVNTLQAVTPSEDALQRGTDALAGFVVMYDRLPCPATAGQGVENCSLKYGGFPWQTVGLAQPLQNAQGYALAYGVYRNSGANADLAIKTSAYAPSFLASLPVVANDPAPTTEWNAPTPVSYTANVNGLDFCEKLRTSANAGYVNTEVSTQVFNAPSIHVNPAFLLADPGNTSAGSAGGKFDDVNNTGLVWDSPAMPKTLNYDDQVNAISFYQLAARLQCPAITARVSAAVRDANAAYDIKRTYDFYEAFNDYNVTMDQAAVDLAQIQDYIADFDLALNIAMSTEDIAVTLSSPEGAIADAISIVNGVIAISMSAVGKFGGVGGVPQGSAANLAANQQSLAAAQVMDTNAEASVTAANTALTAAITEAQSRDAKGWFQ